jgi:chromosomal replication initiation ATPase DnaA
MKYVDSFLEDKKCIKRWDIYGRNSFLGSDDFIRKALSSIENGRENCGEVSGERELHQVGWDEVMQVVLTICQVGEDDILSRNKENVYRKIFIYLLRKYTGLKLHEIGGKLGMKYRAVSEMERNFLKELVDSKLLQKKVAMVERDLKKMTLWGR